MSKFSKGVAHLIALLALVACLVPAALAQVTTGNLQGIVTDPNKAVVAGATVKVTNVDTGVSRETTTNDEGFYRVTNLIPGPNYRIEVTAQGFAPATADNVRVLIATENTGDISVGVSGTVASVTVTEEQLINTTQNQLSQSYTPRQLTELPYAGAVDNLALLTPGVTTPPTGFAFTNGVEFSANGNRTRSNNFQIDGQDNNDNSVAGPTLGFTNSEAIGEYQIITNNFSAEFGRNSGAQINSVTKSGTNEFHGTLFEFHSNSALNARNNIDKRSQAAFQFLGANGFPEFSSLADRFPSPFRDNRFGGSIGGPIKQNKAFFFTTYQRDLSRGEAEVDNLGQGFYTLTPASAAFAAARFPNAATAALTATGAAGGPTTAQGQGSLTVLPPVVDTNGDGVPDAFVFGCSTCFAPLAVTTTTAGGAGFTTLFGGEAVRFRRNDGTSDNSISRVDYNLTDRDQIVGRYIFDRNLFPLQAGGSTIAGSRLNYRDRTHNLGITYTRTISNNIVNEARFNYSNLFVAFGDVTAQTPASINFSTSGIPSLSGLISNFGTTNGLPQDRHVKTYQLQDNVSATLGNHALKFGVDFRRQNLNTFFLPFFQGSYTFTGSANPATSGTLPPGVFFEDETGTPRTGGASAIENFLLGRPRSIGFALGNQRIVTHQNDYFLFVQDDYRILPTLTLNLGLRYEVSTTPFNPLIDLLNARETSGNSIFPAGFDASTRTMQRLPLDKNNFAPRVGFAWTPNLTFLGDRFGNGRTVIRGGFGIAYDPSFFNIALNTVTAAPFVGRGSITQRPGAAGSVSFPFLPSTPSELSLTPGTAGGDPRLFSRTLVDPNFHNPYSMSYNFGIQQELWKNTVLEVRYVGTRTVGQFQSIDTNPRIDFLNAAGTYLHSDAGFYTNGLIAGVRPGTNGNGRVNPAFGRTLTRTNGATGTYNGLQTRFETRFTNSLAFSANYTFSKTIDNSSEIFSTGAGGQTISLPQDPFCTSSCERGLSAFNQKHTFTANFIYNLPYYKEQKGFMGKLLGGYQLNGIVRMGSGRPYNPYEVLGTYDPVGEGSLRPFNGNPNAPAGTIAFGSFAATNLFGDASAAPGSYVVYNTLSPGSQGTVVSAAEVTSAARVIYNDFGLVPAFGLTSAFFPDLEAFNQFGSPFGDVGRNTFLGLPTYSVNLSVFKTTNITERTRIELRAEAFNILNHRNFGVPDPATEDAFTGSFVGSYQNPGFNTGDSRTVRLGLRLIF